ncbi:hypothetical protein [Streptomyces sp. NBC_01237]|uniref:hypothetical protein n=1 Tax=Streptomyces sp. NBC_01237 TaxID=2903790 RepID=UPI002DD96281|nr:hypothetical protein [Streptomyces sp. NBC_01237]WRZ77704.1 hypothetical protein OG251_39555 [Streptomyces sp. NBC_01237]
MTRRRAARLRGGAALAAETAFALLAVAVLHAPHGRLPGDAVLHSWSQAHRPGPALALSRHRHRGHPFAAVVLAGLSSAAPSGSASPPHPDRSAVGAPILNRALAVHEWGVETVWFPCSL